MKLSFLQYWNKQQENENKPIPKPINQNPQKRLFFVTWVIYFKMCIFVVAEISVIFCIIQTEHTSAFCMFCYKLETFLCFLAALPCNRVKH